MLPENIVLKMEKVSFRFNLIFLFSIYIATCSGGGSEIYDPKIIGGQDAVRHEFPWIINMLQKPELSHRCGGVILNAEYVITAAHCVPAGFDAINDIELVAGDHNQNIAEETEQRVEVIKSVRHPNYNTATKAYDVALLKVSPKFRFTTAVQSVSLPDEGAAPATGDVTVAGWGLVWYEPEMHASILQKVIMKIVPFDTCKGRFEAVNFKLTPQMICASDGDLKSGCNGDSGSGLVKIVQQNAGGPKHVLHGLVSFGLRECNGGDRIPSVFVNVPSVLDWIHEEMNAVDTTICTTCGADNLFNKRSTAIGLLLSSSILLIIYKF